MAVYNPVFKEFKRIQNIDDLWEETMGLAELLFCWWGGQDPNPNGVIEKISINSIGDNEAKVHVEFMNYSSVENHELELKKVNGKWRIDDWDSLKEVFRQEIEECIKTGNHK